MNAGPAAPSARPLGALSPPSLTFQPLRAPREAEVAAAILTVGNGALKAAGRTARGETRGVNKPGHQHQTHTAAVQRLPLKIETPESRHLF